MSGFDLFEAGAVIAGLKRNLRSLALFGALCLILLASFALPLRGDSDIGVKRSI